MLEAQKCPKHYVYSAFGENVVFGSGGRMLNAGKRPTPPPRPPNQETKEAQEQYEQNSDIC